MASDRSLKRIDQPDGDRVAVARGRMPDWEKIGRILVIRLRSIGDTVLATPTLKALRRYLPAAKIDVLLEDWVAPLLEGFAAIDRVIPVSTGTAERMRTAAILRSGKYDVVINLHGGTTSGFLTRATGAPYRIGYSNYQYPFLYNLKLSSSSDFWNRRSTHSVEQQLALAGFAGIPVSDLPETELPVTKEAELLLLPRLERESLVDSDTRFALVHPGASSYTKRWASENYSVLIDRLADLDIRSVLVGSKDEEPLVSGISQSARVPVSTFVDLTLPEVTALARRAAVFVGNDSGIAHIAAAVGTPPVVIFGSSNREHWRPWTGGPSRIVFRKFQCQPCPGFECGEFGVPRCILEVDTSEVMDAVTLVLESA